MGGGSMDGVTMGGGSETASNGGGSSRRINPGTQDRVCHFDQPEIQAGSVPPNSALATRALTSSNSSGPSLTPFL